MYSVTDVRESLPDAPSGIGMLTLTPCEHWHDDELEAFSMALRQIGQGSVWRALILQLENAGTEQTKRPAEETGVALSRRARLYSQAFSALRQYPGLVVATLVGELSDETLGLALSCDFRVAAEGAAFGFSDSARNRIPMGGSTQLLPRMIGESLAKRMMLCGHRLDSHQALACGLLDDIVATPEHLAGRATLLVAPSCELDPVVVNGVRQLIEHARMRPLETGFAAERDWQATLAELRQKTR